MPKKFTYEYVYNYFKEQGCELLDNVYIDSKTEMNYKCNCGNIHKTIFSQFKLGKRCNKCHKSARFSYEYVYNYFKEQGCELLDTTYKNVENRLLYKCICGTISKISFSSFSSGKRCNICGKNKKYTYEEVYDYFLKFNYKLIDTVYLNANSTIKSICPNNHIYQTTFSNFRVGHRCSICYQNIKKIKNCKNRDMTRKKRINYLILPTSKQNILFDDKNYLNFIKYKNIKNISNLYEIDHIYPRVAFINNDLDIKYDPIIIKEICNSRDNLRIITREENRSKNRKYNQEEFMSWFENKLKDKL